MTKEDAIKYLQQLYPNGGHCWLDEQRIEAIGMAVKALQEEPDYCCGECAKWVDGKGCSREKQNTHCITDAACKEGVRRGSKQKKPKFKVGDTIRAIDSCLGSPRAICEVCDSWYVTNQGTLDFEFEDNWKLVEEPVSEKKCMFTKDSYTDEDRKVLCEDCKEKCEYSKKEEPVSDDLEEAAWLYYDKNRLPIPPEWDLHKEFIDFFKAGANWQKTKDSTCVSNDLEEAAKEWLIPQLDKSYEPYGEGKMLELTHFDGYAMLDAIEFGANWMLNKITKQDKNK